MNSRIVFHLILMILLLAGATSVTAQEWPLKTYVGLGSGIWVKNKDFCYSPVRYEGRVGQSTALPTDAFKSGKLGPMENRGTMNIFFGVQHAAWNSTGKLRIELGLTRQSFQTGNYRCLRFTDMIDPSQGFVNPSYFSVESIRGSIHYFSIRSNLVFRSEKYKREQRFGLGFMSYYVLNSSYTLHLKDRQQSNFTYHTNDLRVNDKAVGIAPEVLYQCFLMNIGKRRAFVNLTVSTPAKHFTADELRENARLSWMGQLGLILE